MKKRFLLLPFVFGLLLSSCNSSNETLPTKPSNTDGKTYVLELVDGKETWVEKKENTEYQYRIYVGTNDKDTYQMEMSKEEAFNVVDNICATNFTDGYTVYEATGSWKDPESGHIYHEYSLVCYVSGVTSEVVYKACDELIAALNQSTILVEVISNQVIFYNGN